MRDARTYITPPDISVRLQLEDRDTGVNIFDPGSEAESE